METLRLDTTTKREEALKKAAEIIKNGGVVAIPTETVYGLAAAANNDEAIAKVFIAKGRPQDNPLIVHIADVEQLKSVAVEIPKEAELCAERFWPGPFTMVLKKSDAVCESVSRGLDTVAVRLPSHPTAREVICQSGVALAAPSANASGYPSATTYKHVLDDLDGKIDAVLMDNDCEIGLESTVVTFAVSPPRLLRPGAVTVEHLREIIPDLEVDKAVLSDLEKGQKAASPGMKYKHYSPKTEVFLVEGEAEQFASFVNSKQNAVAICFAEDSGISIDKLVYATKSEPESLTKQIFSLLREIDNKKYSAAYVHAPQKNGVGLAVYNRLIRAAAFRVIKL